MNDDDKSQFDISAPGSLTPAAVMEVMDRSSKASKVPRPTSSNPSVCHPSGSCSVATPDPCLDQQTETVSPSKSMTRSVRASDRSISTQSASKMDNWTSSVPLSSNVIPESPTHNTYSPSAAVSTRKRRISAVSNSSETMNSIESEHVQLRRPARPRNNIIDTVTKANAAEPTVPRQEAIKYRCQHCKKVCYSSKRLKVGH